MRSIGVNVFHIGLTAEQYPWNFLWLDGSNNSFRNWVNDAARSFAGEPLFASVGLNGWFSSVGNNTAGFLCKYTPGK